MSRFWYKPQYFLFAVQYIFVLFCFASFATSDFFHMLEHVIVRAKITNSGWGNDIIPDNKLVEASAADAVR